MNIRDLPERSIQTIRLGRCGRDRIEWGEWHEAEVFTARRTKSIQRRHQSYAAGVCTITAPGTADFNPEHDYIPANTRRPRFQDGEQYPWGYFMCEDWCMEIKNIEPEWRTS